VRYGRIMERTGAVVSLKDFSEDRAQESGQEIELPRGLFPKEKRKFGRGSIRSWKDENSLLRWTGASAGRRIPTCGAKENQLVTLAEKVCDSP